MTLFSAWFFVGFVIGAIVGTLATDLTRQDFSTFKADFTPWFWRWPGLQMIIFLGLLWIILLLTTTFYNTGYENTNFWRSFFVGSIVGAAAAPWVWLHFVRSFSGEKISDND